MKKFNIEAIMLMGELYERAFFNWLNLNSITWCVVGSDLNYIGLFKDSDIVLITEYWEELKSCSFILFAEI